MATQRLNWNQSVSLKQHSSPTLTKNYTTSKIWTLKRAKVISIYLEANRAHVIIMKEAFVTKTSSMTYKKPNGPRLRAMIEKSTALTSSIFRKNLFLLSWANSNDMRPKTTSTTSYTIIKKTYGFKLMTKAQRLTLSVCRLELFRFQLDTKLYQLSSMSTLRAALCTTEE